MARPHPHVIDSTVRCLTPAIAEVTTEGGGALLYLYLADSRQVQSSGEGQPFAGFAIAQILQEHYAHIAFGPCLRGAVFELRSSCKPSCTIVDQTLEVDFGAPGGHFHLAIGATTRFREEGPPYARTFAAFVGYSGGLFGPIEHVQGFRVWNDKGEQCFNIFFDTADRWVTALETLLKDVSWASPEACDLPAGTRAEWAENTPQARLLFNLRLLYSEPFDRSVRRYEAVLPGETRKLLQLIPPSVVSERQARLANLHQYISRNSRLAHWILDSGQLRTCLQHWVDSPDFWSGRGRTLIESFCLYLYPWLRRQSLYHAELIRLEGVIAGLAQSGGVSSPWNGPGLSLGHESSTGNGVRVESYSSEVEVVDANGSLSSSFLSRSLPSRQSISVRADHNGVTVSVL